MFARIDIFNITITNSIKNKMERIGRIKKLWEIRNKKNNKNIIDLKITIFLKTEIIVKEWKKRAAKFIFDG